MASFKIRFSQNLLLVVINFRKFGKYYQKKKKTVLQHSTTQRYSLLNSGIFSGICFPGVFLSLVKQQSSIRTLRECFYDVKRIFVRGDALTQAIQSELLKGEKSCLSSVSLKIIIIFLFFLSGLLGSCSKRLAIVSA